MSWPPSFWISAGLGPGSAGRYDRLIALSGSGWFATGPFVAGLRRSFVSALEYGDSADDLALLVGARTPPGPFALIGALGYSGLSINCDGGAPCPKGFSTNRENALAFSLQARASLSIIGVGVEVFGASGSGMRRFSGAVATVQLGWFPR